MEKTKEKIKVINVLGRMDNKKDHTLESANRVYDTNGLSPTLPTCCGGGHQAKILCKRQSDDVDYEYAIRKVTPIECLRLMNISEVDVQNIAKTVSKTQQYKQAGNSIVVAVLIAVFSQLGIKGIKKWNDMTDEERMKLIYKGCYLNESTDEE